jgi:DNA-binding LacI/PurR family transcriptional regulator
MKGVIGLQTIDLAGAFSKPFCVEASRITAKADAALILFPGHNYLRDGFYYRAFNLIYNFMKKPVIDDLILATGTFFNFTPPDLMSKVLTGLLIDLPLISLELEIPGAFNLCIDNSTGIKKAVEHLAIKHRCRRIGFLRGPTGNPEANQRYGAYLEAMQDLGLEPPEGGVFQGYFLMESGADAVAGQIDYIKTHLDGLVCANDLMAMGAIRVLEAAGLKIPGDLAITGFDDLEEARFLRTPLTTVHQPLSSIGRLAAVKALELLDAPPAGTDRSGLTTLLADLRIRASCGCSSAREKQVFLERYSDVLIQRSLLDDFIRLELSPYLWDEDVKRISGEIFRLIREILENSPSEESVSILLDRLEKCITAEIHDNGVELDWQEIISLVHTVSRKLAPQHLLWSHYDFFQRARIIAGEKMEQFQGLKRLRQERGLAEPLRLMYGSILASESPDGIFEILDRNLPALGIDTCLIALFEGKSFVPGLFTLLPFKSRLVYSRKAGNRVPLPGEGIPFETSRFFPDGHFDPQPGRSYVLYPLFFNVGIQGLLFFSLSDKGYVANEDIRQMLSAGFYHIGYKGLECFQ